MEEVYVPTLSNYLQATADSFTSQQVMKMERRLMSVLSFRLTPVTLVTWANWYMQMWDNYCD